MLNGRKRWTSNSPVAGFIVTLARTGDRLTMFIVDTGLHGVRVGEPNLKVGNRGQLTADVWFECVELGDDAMLGGVEGHGMRHALTTLTLGRIGKRSASRLPPTSTGSSSWPRGPTEIENARIQYLKAVLRRDAGETFPEPEAAMAKHYATRLPVDMARDAVQALGGLGVARELRADGTPGSVEAIYRDSKIGEIYEGTNEIQKWIIARNIFGKEITA